MRIQFKGSCRGSAKIFIKVSIKLFAPENRITLQSKGPQSKEVPSKLLKFKAVDDSDDDYIIILPDMPFIQELIFREWDSQGVKRDEVKKSVNNHLAKWESRFNYIANKQLTYQIRDYDEVDKDGNIFLSIAEAIPADSKVRLRIRCRLPYLERPDLNIRCVDLALRPLLIEPIILGDAIISSTVPEQPIAREIIFSLDIPIEFGTCLIIVDDEAHCEFRDFMVWDDPRRLAFTGEWLEGHSCASTDPEYRKWLKREQPKYHELIRQSQYAFEWEPYFSVIVPLYKTPINLLDEMIRSVLSQSYAQWELVLVNASPEEKALRERIEVWSERDLRIKIVELGCNEGISSNTRHGIDAATGDYICFLDHDDVIEPDALFEYAKAIIGNPQTGVLYCDEDKILFNGRHSEPYFKPDFSIDLLRNNNYICHMLCIKKSIIDAIEPSPKDVDGAQDYDMILKAVEKTDHVYHVPKVLYHWRMTQRSAAASADNKSYAIDAGVKAVSRHLKRMNIEAQVEADEIPFVYRIHYPLPKEEPMVSVVVAPSKDGSERLEKCIESIVRHSQYSNYEILIMRNEEEGDVAENFASVLDQESTVIRFLERDSKCNAGQIINFGVQNAQGEYVVLMDDNTEVRTDEWIAELLTVCCRPDVGAVGARILYPDNVIKYSGIALIDGKARNLNSGFSVETPGYFALPDKAQDLSAVKSTCMMFKKEDFKRVSGFDESFEGDFYDIDFCLKLRSLGLNIVYWPYVELVHFEPIVWKDKEHAAVNGAAISAQKDAALLAGKWAEYIVQGDPYYNKNLSGISGYYEIERERFIG